MAAEHPCESGSWLRFAKASMSDRTGKKKMMRHRASKMKGQSQLSATPIKPLQSHLPSLQLSLAFLFFFQLQFHFGSQPWQLWQSGWEPGGSTCKLDYNLVETKKMQTSRMSLDPCWPILLCLPQRLFQHTPRAHPRQSPKPIVKEIPL